MRLNANQKKPKKDIVRLMIYNDEFGTYLFGYKKMEDCNSEFDEWFETEKDALETCESKYEIKETEWNKIPNPEINCQHDWINPVRIKKNKLGKPVFGKFEKLINGKWV